MYFNWSRHAIYVLNLRSERGISYLTHYISQNVLVCNSTVTTAVAVELKLENKKQNNDAVLLNVGLHNGVERVHGGP